DHRAVAEPDPVGGIVEGAGRPDRPVHEILARVHGVGVGVEDVVDRESADLDGHPRDIALAGHLAVVALDGFLLAAEPERLPQKQARRAVAGIWKLRFLGFTVGEAGGAGRVVQPEALQKLWIVVELAPVPQLEAKKGAGGPRRSGLRPGRKAVDAEARRVKWRVGLRGVSGLSFACPLWALWLRCRQGG